MGALLEFKIRPHEVHCRFHTSLIVTHILDLASPCALRAMEVERTSLPLY